jgi:hypothetical protein
MRKIATSIFACFLVGISFAQNVGIGTTTPIAKLEIVDADDAKNKLLINSGPSTTGFSFSNVLGSYPTLGFNTKYLYNYMGNGFGSFLQFNSADGAMRYWTSANAGVAGAAIASFNNPLSIEANGDTRISGNVGINVGTLSNVKLLVNGSGTGSTTNTIMLRNSSFDTLFRVLDNARTSIGYSGGLFRPLTIQGNGINFYANANDFGGAIFPDASHNLILWSDAAGPGQNVVLQPSWGQVTIGTYTPAAGYKVSVAGKIICTEARVQAQASWPDYVFAEDYQLPSLESVEKFVKQNKHLPNIPPAAEVEKQGFDLGDMNRKLLEKVEQLTLHLIEMEKEIKMAKIEIAELKKRK